MIKDAYLKAVESAMYSIKKHIKFGNVETATAALDMLLDANATLLEGITTTTSQKQVHQINGNDNGNE